MKTLADNLRDLRVARGITVTALAQLCGTDRSAVRQLQNGYRVNPSLATLLAIAKALDVPVASLLLGVRDIAIQRGAS